MALTVEDGTGVEGADAYVAIADVDSYATKFGKTGWSALVAADKEIHIRRATRFIDDRFPFPGTPKTAKQGLFFPVEELYVRSHEITGVPRQLKDAVCELAIISVTNDLIESVGARAYTYRKVVVGDIEKTERYGSSNNQSIFHSVELLLTPLLTGYVGPGVKLIELRRA